MPFEVIPSRTFASQVTTISQKSKTLILSKLMLAKENPYRFKSLNSGLHSRVFRIRLNVDGIESRVNYILDNFTLIVIGITNRKDDYRELDELIQKALQEQN